MKIYKCLYYINIIYTKILENKIIIICREPNQGSVHEDYIY